MLPVGAPGYMWVSPVGFSFKESPPPPQAPGTRCSEGEGAQESGHTEAQAGAPGTSISQQPDPCKWATGNTSGGAAGADERPGSPRVGGGQGGGVQTILEVEVALTCWCSSGTGCWPVSAPPGSLPGEGTAVETRLRPGKCVYPSHPSSPGAAPAHTLTWIWLRRTAARRIMALARRWNSLPISRDFSKVVLR